MKENEKEIKLSKASDLDLHQRSYNRKPHMPLFRKDLILSELGTFVLTLTQPIVMLELQTLRR